MIPGTILTLMESGPQTTFYYDSCTMSISTEITIIFSNLMVINWFDYISGRAIHIRDKRIIFA